MTWLPPSFAGKRVPKPQLQGFATGLRPQDGMSEMHPLPDVSDAENFMRFSGFGIVNSHAVVGGEPYPKVTGDQCFTVDWEAKMLIAEWKPGCRRLQLCIESKWYSQPALHYFPFDSHEMCAIFWTHGCRQTQTWQKLRISQFGRSYGLGTTLQDGWDDWDLMGGESPLSLVAGLILTMMAMQFSYADSVDLFDGASMRAGYCAPEVEDGAARI
eukprot:Skav234653  [mRNA]  locus=scaffold1131:117947:135240:- [translate_table: standard]